MDKAIRINPRNAAAYLNRGIAWYAKGNWDKALDDYNQVIRLDPRSHAAYNNRGNIALEKKELDAAIADFNRAIELNPKASQAYLNRGLGQKMKGNETEAEQDFARCRALDRELGASIDQRLRKLGYTLSATRESTWEFSQKRP